MAEVLVIADDFTGANDTGALLRQRGFSTFSSFRDELPDGAWNRYEAGRRQRRGCTRRR